jgi:phospholipase A1
VIGSETRAALVLCSVLVPAACALAQAPSLSECHSIASAADRLACYDRVSGRPSPAALAPAPDSPRAPNAPAPFPSAIANQQAVDAKKPKSMIDAEWDFNVDSPRHDLRFFHENYLLFGRYTDRVNVGPYVPIFEAAGEPVHLDSTEAKFQLSFKGRLWATDDRRWGVWAAYTQLNQWQVYNEQISRPFRETNYMPELLVSYRPGVELPGGFGWNLASLSFNHQSNGRTDTLSRSWNRIIGTLGMDNGSLALLADLWYRIPESDEKDDNPDITDYYGHGGIRALHRWRENSFSAMLRGNFSTGKGAFQFGWTSPPVLGPLRAYVQIFTGYGESMIDYNWRQTTIGAGFALNDGL